MRQKRVRERLVKAAKLGVPPVSAISNDLLERFMPQIKLLIVKQFVGLCIKAVLAEEGFEVSQTRVRVYKDKLFTTASTYEQVKQETDTAGSMDAAGSSDDALERMMAALSEQQALRAAQALERAFPGVLRRARTRRLQVESRNSDDR